MWVQSEHLPDRFSPCASCGGAGILQPPVRAAELNRWETRLATKPVVVVVVIFFLSSCNISHGHHMFLLFFTWHRFFLKNYYYYYLFIFTWNEDSVFPFHFRCFSVPDASPFLLVTFDLLMCFYTLGKISFFLLHELNMLSFLKISVAFWCIVTRLISAMLKSLQSLFVRYWIQPWIFWDSSAVREDAASALDSS